MKKFLSLLLSAVVLTTVFSAFTLNVSAATEVADPIDWTDLAESYDGTFMVLEDSPVYGNGEIESPIVGFKGTFQRQLHNDIKNAWGTKYTYQQTMTQPVEENEVSLTYNLGDRDVVAFTLRAYMPDNNSSYYLDFYASKDGSTWDKLTENAAVNGYTLTKGDYNSVTTNAETGETVYGNFREHVFSSDSLLEGCKYLKVQLPYIQNRAAVWLLQVGTMKIAFDTTDAPTALNTLSTMPCDIKGAIYNDTPSDTFGRDDNTLRTVHKNVNNEGTTRINLDLRNDQNQNGTSRTYGRGTGDRGTLTWNDTAAFAELMRGSGITYHNTDFDMTGFALWSYTGVLDNRGSIFFWVSEDGEEWTKLEKHTDYKMNFGNLALTTSGSKYEVVYYADSLPKGTRYLKFEFSRTLDNPMHHWQTQIGKICVGFDDSCTLLPSPIELTNNTYVDECNNADAIDVTNSEEKAIRVRQPLNIQGVSISTTDVSAIPKRRGEERAVRRNETIIKDTENNPVPQDLEYGILYTSPEGNMTDVVLWGHAPNGFEIYASPDGEEYTRVEDIMSKTPSSVPSYPRNEWNVSMYWTSLPKGTKNIKVLFSSDFETARFWDSELYKAVIAYDDIDAVNDDAVVTYAAPSGANLSDSFSVYARAKAETEWKKVDVYQTSVANGSLGSTSNIKSSSFAYFDMSGVAEVKVTANKDSVQSFKIRPDAYGIDFVKTDNTIQFSIDKPMQISIEADGDTYNNLQLFINPLENPDDIPLRGAANVIYFPAGYWTQSNAGRYINKYTAAKPVHQINAKSDMIIYIAGGAVVNANIMVGDSFDATSGLSLSGAKNVKICGRGILNMTNWCSDNGMQNGANSHGITIKNSENVTIDGIILNNPGQYGIYGGASKNITINNFKGIDYMTWGDGIDMMSCSDVAITNSFIRSSDDCIAIYADRFGHTGDSKNWTIKNNVLWADMAHGIHIGIHGSQDSESRRTIQNIEFTDNHILNAYSPDSRFRGAMAINSGDENIVKNVTFRNVTVDGIKGSALLYVRTVKNAEYNPEPGYSVENILFDNIKSYCSTTGKSYISGYSDERTTKDVVLKNISINGVTAKSFDEVGIVVENYCDNVNLISTVKNDERAVFTYQNSDDKQLSFISAKHDSDGRLSGVNAVSFSESDGIMRGETEYDSEAEVYCWFTDTQMPLCKPFSVK